VSEIVINIRKDLKKNSNKKTKESSKRFFKEEVILYGVKSAIVSKIAKKYFQEIKELNKKELFLICEELLKSDYCEEAYIVSNWLPKKIELFEEKDIKIFRKWIDLYINNWAKCDGFCNHTIGDLLETFPEIMPEIKSWSKSKNKWLKRASAVSLILPARQGKYLKDAFEISDVLLLDPEDMVLKGYGWLLKEASRKHQKEVLSYVIKNKKIMPRTSLRYAIELMPENLRQKAMKK
jgi:3-methyladenine DNA glycosylase AlkD